MHTLCDEDVLDFRQVCLGIRYAPLRPPYMSLLGGYSQIVFFQHVHVRNVYPLIRHMYIEKPGGGVAGLYLIFLFLIQNIHCGYSFPIKFSIFAFEKMYNLPVQHNLPARLYKNIINVFLYN